MALAKKHIDEKSRISDALGKIEIAGSHLLSLINDVLDMSRINSGRLKITDELFSLGDLLHEIPTITRPQAEQHGHQFLFDTGEILAENLYGDSLRLRQIYVNIINNSVKYTKDNGRINLFVTQEMKGDRCLLIFRCEDNGIGMSQEFLNRIFEPFERVNSSTISGIEGTGLGRSIVKKLIEAMDDTPSPDERIQRLKAENNALLSEELFPALDDLHNASKDTVANLEEFAGALIDWSTNPDCGVYILIHDSLLRMHRFRKDRANIIKELYMLGISCSATAPFLPSFSSFIYSEPCHEPALLRMSAAAAQLSLMAVWLSPYENCLKLFRSSKLDGTALSSFRMVLNSFANFQIFCWHFQLLCDIIH